MNLPGTRFVTSPNGSALGLPAGEYWAVPDAEMKRMQERIVELEAERVPPHGSRVLAWESGGMVFTTPHLATAPIIESGGRVRYDGRTTGNAFRGKAWYVARGQELSIEGLEPCQNCGQDMRDHGPHDGGYLCPVVETNVKADGDALP